MIGLIKYPRMCRMLGSSRMLGVEREVFLATCRGSAAPD